MTDSDEHVHKCEIALTSPKERSDAIHSQLERVWVEAPHVNSADRFSFETALIELVSNVFNHGDFDVAPSCVVTLNTYPDRIECSVVDSGSPRNLQIAGHSTTDEIAESGRELLLIQALVDELSYIREGDLNRWQMVKKTARREFSLETEPRVSLPRPINEAARQQALESLKVLDTAPEDRLDIITRMAQKSFGVETCAISLIDNDRQWFKSRVGLAVEETIRSVAFCDHTIRQYDVMVVPDAQVDPRFQNNPLVTGDPHIRFYAGYPLEVENGQPIGSFCIFDSKPRTLTEPEKKLLRDLALIARNELNWAVYSTRSPENLEGVRDAERIAEHE